MPVALRLFDPGAAVHPVSVGTIKLPAPAFARRAVALDIAQMRLGALEAVAAEFDGPEFHDHAALPEGGITVTRRQDTPDPGAASDASTGKRRLARPPGRPAPRNIGGRDHASEDCAGARLPTLAGAKAEPRFKHRTRLASGKSG